MTTYSQAVAGLRINTLRVQITLADHLTPVLERIADRLLELLPPRQRFMSEWRATFYDLPNARRMIERRLSA